MFSIFRTFISAIVPFFIEFVVAAVEYRFSGRRYAR